MAELSPEKIMLYKMREFSKCHNMQNGRKLRFMTLTFSSITMKMR